MRALPLPQKVPGSTTTARPCSPRFICPRSDATLAYQIGGQRRSDRYSVLLCAWVETQLHRLRLFLVLRVAWLKARRHRAHPHSYWRRAGGRSYVRWARDVYVLLQVERQPDIRRWVKLELLDHQFLGARADGPVYAVHGVARQIIPDSG